MASNVIRNLLQSRFFSRGHHSHLTECGVLTSDTNIRPRPSLATWRSVAWLGIQIPSGWVPALSSFLISRIVTRFSHFCSSLVSRLITSTPTRSLSVLRTVVPHGTVFDHPSFSSDWRHVDKMSPRCTDTCRPRSPMIELANEGATAIFHYYGYYLVVLCTSTVDNSPYSVMQDLQKSIPRLPVSWL